MKRKSLLLAALCFLAALPTAAFVSCGKTQTEEPVGPVGAVSLSDFETYKPDFQLIRVHNHFGAINVNTDPNYVKSGKASAKLQPLGGYISTTSPFMYYPLYSETFGFDYKDLSRLRQVTAEIYNAEDYEIKMDYGIVMEVPNVDMVNKTSPVKVTLAPGWNTVTYDVDVSVINILYDITDAQGVYFGFERVGSRDIEDAPTLYLDDIQLHYSRKAKEVENLLSFSENEVCNFDKLYQRYVIYDETENPAATPSYSVVRTSDLGVKATSGNYALTLTTLPGDGSNTYQKIVIPQGTMQACSMTTVDEKEWDSWYFCFDLYALDSAMTFYPEFFDSGYNTCYNKWACDAGVGKWTTYRIKFTELKAAMVTSPGFFRLAWGEYDTDKGALSFLIDSFRIEKSA